MHCTTLTERAATAAETAANAERFDRLFKEKSSSFAKSDNGRYVVINIETGDHVVADTPGAAMHLAEETFGSRDWCWSRRIDEHFRVTAPPPGYVPPSV
jgi:hypothetical protein